MIRMRRAILPLLIAAACSQGEAGRIAGTVRFIELEGGCWVIDTAQGRVQPVELPAQFRIDGLAVRVALREAPDAMSACQAAPLKHLDAIETATAGR